MAEKSLPYLNLEATLWKAVLTSVQTFSTPVLRSSYASSPAVLNSCNSVPAVVNLAPTALSFKLPAYILNGIHDHSRSCRD